MLLGCTTPKADITVVTYNIRHGVGLDRVLDLERTARVIADAKPQIVVLNEVDDGTSRAFGVKQADSLGNLLGMHAQFARSIDYDGGFYGNALLSTFPILDMKIIDLSTDSTLEGRSIFRAQLQADSDTLIVMGTHLGLDEDEQLLQIQWILDILPASGKLILAGDLNFIPESETYHMLSTRLQDGILELDAAAGPTFPADSPERRIDYIFLGENLVPVELDTDYDPAVTSASDHFPQILIVRLR